MKRWKVNTAYEYPYNLVNADDPSDKLCPREGCWEKDWSTFDEDEVPILVLASEAQAEIDRLRKCCTQRGARMQKMREWMASLYGLGPPSEWWYFCEQRPEAKKWFDENGVPK